MNKRLLIVEEALKNRAGHWYEYNKAIVEEARSRGIQVTLLAHHNIDPEVCGELNAIPWFPVTNWDQHYNHPNVIKRMLGILRHNLLVARLMRLHFKKAQPYDIVLVPTVVLYHWLAWRWLATRGVNRWFSKLVLLTRNNAGEYDENSREYVFKASARVLALVVKTFLRPVERGEVELGADSSRLADQYNSLSGVPFSTYPHPQYMAPGVTQSTKTAQGKKLICSALGPPRYEKGSDLILYAVWKFLKTCPKLPVRFVIQWTDAKSLPGNKSESLLGKMESHSDIEIIYSSLSSEDYRRRIEESDLILVPYRRAQYHARLSGIAIEAFQAGVSCICISDTWLADCMIAMGSGIAIESETGDALYCGILKYVQMHDHYKNIANNRIHSARRLHSSSAFLDKLFGI